MSCEDIMFGNPVKVFRPLSPEEKALLPTGSKEEKPVDDEEANFSNGPLDSRQRAQMRRKFAEAINRRYTA